MNSNTDSVTPTSAQEHLANINSRVAQHQSTEQPKDESYRWQETEHYQQLVTKERPSSGISPMVLKRALEHEKSAEMVEKLVEESNQTDPWCKTISQLNLAKLVQQLALNSAMNEQDNQVKLTLRANQAHLDNQRAREQLTEELSRVFNKSIQLSIELGSEGETPLDIRDRLYQQRLQVAIENIEQDPNVTILRQRFSATIDDDSIRPL
ncbi:hypothetical protein L0B53_17525 [Vibrio sp. SS-MA-C1-2]|uniref:DNA polymerase III subunit gamma/tau C-terminal domain-containing protein n=1 Tax=Vibrio sp. SS-MA-C1-2 TaxID=2908646 RepID=UPI001F2D2B4E|nr:DNA polymerase III subunit gamma/tau C-terminal domain-containing protein [Vibrio sp. SS-MA-C1-2]UJF18767.1 hypothetical protein L0B53_17525 [Vibrio sp. SS-MA-C1-2]